MRFFQKLFQRFQNIIKGMQPKGLDLTNSPLNIPMPLPEPPPVADLGPRDKPFPWFTVPPEWYNKQPAWWVDPGNPPPPMPPPDVNSEELEKPAEDQDGSHEEGENDIEDEDGQNVNDVDSLKGPSSEDDDPNEGRNDDLGTSDALLEVESSTSKHFGSTSGGISTTSNILHSSVSGACDVDTNKITILQGLVKEQRAEMQKLQVQLDYLMAMATKHVGDETFKLHK